MVSNLSNLIDSLSSLKQEKKVVDGIVKMLETKIALAEKDLMSAMDAEGVIETKNTLAKVTLSESAYPQVEDWGLFSSFILNNGYLHLLERRPAVLAYRELLSLGTPVPGVLPFVKRKLTYKES